MCAFTKNNAQKLRKLANLNPNLSKYHYPHLLITKEGIQKELSILDPDLQRVVELSSENVLPFIITHNPKKSKVLSVI